jgi:hypothetical protein
MTSLRISLEPELLDAQEILGLPGGKVPFLQPKIIQPAPFSSLRLEERQFDERESSVP